MKTIYIIVHGESNCNSNEPYYCAATTKAKAEKILKDDIENGSLEADAYIDECQLH